MNERAAIARGRPEMNDAAMDGTHIDTPPTFDAVVVGAGFARLYMSRAAMARAR